jgi:hypothetical protein
VADLKTNRVDPLSRLIDPVEFWRMKWKPWCELTQFYHFAGDPSGLVKGNDERPSVFERYRPVVSGYRGKGPARTMREDLIEMEAFFVNREHSHWRLWNERRVQSPARI